MSDPVNEEFAKRERGWMGTFSGRKFYPLAPRSSDVDIVAIARGLAMTCRYGGQVRKYYSVAEHCVHVSHHVWPTHAREALLHDSAEAYIGDMIRPLKHQPEMSEFRRCETVIEDAVFRRFDIVQTPESRAAVKLVDDRILVDEIRALSSIPEYYLSVPPLNGVMALGIDLPCWDPYEAERQYLARYKELFG